MGSYDVQQVCLNGHQITDTYNQYPQHRKNFCDTCGEATIHQCQECNHPIQGDYHVDGVIGLGSETEIPTHCSNCGNQFPWTKKKSTLQDNVMEQNEVNHFTLIEQVCSRFHLISRQLKNRYNDRQTLEIEDEYDTQDLLHALLHIYFDDIRPEEWTPSYAGGCSRVDFLLKQEGIVIEVKKTRKTLKAKHVGEQLIVDIARYQSHPDCNKLLCFVYDPDGWVSNPKGLENDLNQKEDEFQVKVMIVPKGH
ncbi:DUF2321 domain-containing protein [uncultured Shewanella sp.]|uniref:DUF2321 domain-containing protein n=1 Tax=uncultured Shewanella sp. TaxID=173975 RepID=UPI00260AFEC8|nr:DUF2321 domain-containing protein [uncultured Shewanella sp.]